MHLHAGVLETVLYEHIYQNGHSGFPWAAAWGNFYIDLCTFSLSFEFFTVSCVMSL